MISLETNPLFCHLPPEVMERLTRHVQERYVPAGAHVFREGDPGDGLYFVKAGRVDISSCLADGERHVFTTVAAGEIFGEMAVLDQLPRSASASAAVDSTICFVPGESVSALLEESPELMLKFARAISGRLRKLNRHYARELVAAERLALLGRFAQSIVHDLKNPLTIIRMAASLACGEESTAAKREQGHRWINQQLDRMGGLVNDILDYTRPGDGIPGLIVGDYSQFVASTVSELQSEGLLRNCKLECTNAAPSVRVRFNPRRLGRVFWNLVQNAVDAMPGGGAIRLRFECMGGQIATQFKDTGQGIPPELGERLFDPFTTAGKSHGTGLGLAICRQIVEEHGGRILAGNGQDGGAIFTFTLPRAAAA